MFFLNRIARKKEISSETLEILKREKEKNLRNKQNKKSY